MSSRRISELDLEYPVLWLRKNRYEVFSRPGIASLKEGGLLVEGHGLAHRVVDVDVPLFLHNRLIADRERGQIVHRGATFICEGEPWTITVDDVLRRIAWVVSARGHFESPQGFGRWSEFGTATSVRELLEMVLRMPHIG